MHLTGNGYLLRTGLKRRNRRRAIAAAVFGTVAGALGFFVVLNEVGSLFVAICGALAAALIGGSMINRINEPAPEAMKAYAAEHSLGVTTNNLPAVTPMLLQPFGSTSGFVFGSHPSGFEGRIGVFNFVRSHRMYFNVIMQFLTRFYWPPAKGVTMLAAVHKVPRMAEVLPVLLCERRYGGLLLNGVEEAARGLRRVHLESVELDRQYEVFAHPRQEPSWIRRLFSPSFVEWMSGELTSELSFEIFDGWLTVAAPLRGELTEAELERISQLAFEVMSRLHTELRETQLARPPALR